MENIDFTNLTILVVITVAIVDAIKKATGDKLKMWYMLISAGVGAVLYAIGMYAPEAAQGFFKVGLVASGLYVIAGKVSNKNKIGNK